MALDAISAGKDIYLEKPVTHTLEEGPRLRAAVEGSKQVVQTGTQNRSMPHFFQAKEIIANGGLGKIAFVETYFYQNYARLNPARFTVDHAKLDWKGFLGSAPDQPVDPVRFQWWRWYWDFGEGTLTDLFTHVVDVSHWFLDRDTPESASAMGFNSLIPTWQTPDVVNACMQYPGGLMVVYNSHDGRLPARRRDALPRYQSHAAHLAHRLRDVGRARPTGGARPRRPRRPSWK